MADAGAVLGIGQPESAGHLALLREARGDAGSVHAGYRKGARGAGELLTLPFLLPKLTLALP